MQHLTMVAHAFSFGDGSERLVDDRPNHLTLVETWRDLKALEAHESAAHTVKFHDISTPMSGALFD